MGSTLQRPLGFALFVTAGTVIFGDFAQDIASWIICLDTPTGELCKENAKVEAIMLATLVSTMVAVLSATVIAERSGADLRAALLTVSGALLGAYFTLMKAAARGNDYPLWSRLEVATYIYVTVILLFAVGPILLLRMGANSAFAASLVRRLAIAVLVGGVIGVVVQILAEALWPVLYAVFEPGGETALRRGAQKFVITPGATVTATVAWGVLMLDPWLRDEGWKEFRDSRMPWLVGFAFCGVLLAGGYGAFGYFIDNGSPRDWLVDAGIGRSGAALIAMALMLPGLVAFACVVVALDRRLKPVHVVLAALAGTVGAGLLAGFIGPYRLDAGFRTGDVLGFIVSHALASAPIGAGIYVVDRLARSDKSTQPKRSDHPFP